MTAFVATIAFAGGYAASIYSWDKVKGIFLSADSLIKSLEAKAAALKAKL